MKTLVRKTRFWIQGHDKSLKFLLQGPLGPEGMEKKELMGLLRALKIISVKPEVNGCEIGINGNGMDLVFNGETKTIHIPETDTVGAPTIQRIRDLMMSAGVREPQDVWTLIK